MKPFRKKKRPSRPEFMRQILQIELFPDRSTVTMTTDGKQLEVRR